jgi:hypothetical protein
MFKFLIGTIVAFSAAQALAIGPCELSNQVNGDLGGMLSRYSSTDIGQLTTDLMRECGLEARLKTLSTKMNVEKNQLYKAIKYVDRGFYESARNVKPVSKIYQTTKAAGKLPIDQQSDEIWQNFVMGYSQMPAETERLKNGQKISFEMLKRVHKGFYQISTEVGDFAHEPHPGEFFHERIPMEKNQSPWWSQTITPAIVADVQSINADAQAWGLLNGSKPVNEIPVYLIRVTDKEVFRPNSSEHKAILNNLVHMINESLAVIDSGYQALPSAGVPPMSPMRLAMYSQKVFVSLHPFIEGNGRTSRFLQDLILNYFEMPSASSGDLMNADTLTPFATYYDMAMSKTEELISRLEYCAKNPKSNNYDCQEL